ncbi:Hypothetical Protein FCC1311_043622 [Hondaea fermentalgiana]|uniref:DOT1 domain-containing protein n=1 Tax=Hondaea fermentalgiana TaxID=2315210 RepID=A0A2R5GCU5_9STRA|nr:Hypothetical Protein FCC1311_043622 [Hondaea fermentalgiana]|eukprot:GBG28139.1 Hypothetical Protein FCC1311_043622 [Hondaea fermentalgiana]
MATPSSKSSLSSQDLSQETATIASDEIAAISSDTSQNTGNFHGSVRSGPSVLLREFSMVNRKVSSLHEHVSPIYTMREREAFGINEEYGGITGTLRPSCFERLARFLRGEIIKGARVFVGSGSADVPPVLSAAYQLEKTSVFCDIGSGTGRPAFYFACLPIRASVGFDVDPMQVLNSLHAQRLLHRVEATSSLQRAPTCFFHENVLTLTSLGPTTHAFAFLGYPAIVKATTLLVAKSSVRVFIPVVLHFGELRHTGILDPDPVDDVEDPIVLLPTMTMPGGSSYSGMVIPLTPTRRRRVLERLGDTSTNKILLK